SPDQTAPRTRSRAHWRRAPGRRWLSRPLTRVSGRAIPADSRLPSRAPRLQARLHSGPPRRPVRPARASAATEAAASQSSRLAPRRARAQQAAPPFDNALAECQGPELRRVLAFPAGPPFELAEAYQRAIDDGLLVSAFEVGPTRDLTDPLDLVQENFAYLNQT